MGLGNLATWEPAKPGNLEYLETWEPLPRNLQTVRGGILAAPTCSGTFTMAEDPKPPLLGKNMPVTKHKQLKRRHDKHHSCSSEHLGCTQVYQCQLERLMALDVLYSKM